MQCGEKAGADNEEDPRYPQLWAILSCLVYRYARYDSKRSQDQGYPKLVDAGSDG